jgi:hypothetical protein
LQKELTIFANDEAGVDLPDRSPVAADQVEHGEAVLVAGDGLTIDYASSRQSTVTTPHRQDDRGRARVVNLLSEGVADYGALASSGSG